MSLNISGYNRTISGVERINLLDAIRDVCQQVNEQIIICAFLILTFWVMLRLVIPISWSWFTGHADNSLDPRVAIVRPIVDKIYSFYITFSENIAMLSAVYMVLIFWQIGLSTGFKVWAFILLGVIILVQGSNIINYFRRHGKDGIMKDVKEKREKFYDMMRSQDEDEDEDEDGDMGN